jgi:AraC family transcriptional regulator of adaptative response / DNA-3-methyladenine glycosylase II
VRFDGRFFVGVISTGIFCRPICPAPTPKARNCTYWRSAAAAQQAGFRPCLRCRPEAAPGTPAWRGTAASVSRALRLIEAGALDQGGSVDALAERLGIGPRHLRRLFEQHLGTTPRAVAKMRRVLFAKQLIDETDLPMTEVAISAGYTSQRRFNACIREVYHRSPSELRRGPRNPGRATRAGSGVLAVPARIASPALPVVGATPVASGASQEPVDSPRQIELTLPFRPPFAWQTLLGFVRLRAIPGVEWVEGDRYARSLRTAAGVGWLCVELDEDKQRLRVGVRLSSIKGLIDLREGLRRLFDLDADAEAIDAVLARAPGLTAHVAAIPGVRVPGAFEGFETAVRAILGQQISVKGATTLAGRIAERWGSELPEQLGAPARLTRVFPDARTLVEARFEEIGLTRSRAQAIRNLARTVLAEPGLLAPGAGLDAQTARWEALPGIGPWTAQYVAMRVLREPDALPTGDLGLRKAITKNSEKPRPARDVEKSLEGCRPYRAYAAMRLWDRLGDAERV